MFPCSVLQLSDGLIHSWSQGPETVTDHEKQLKNYLSILAEFEVGSCHLTQDPAGVVVTSRQQIK